MQKKMEEFVTHAKLEKIEKKDFVTKIKKLSTQPDTDPLLAHHGPLYFRVFDGNDAKDEIVKFLKSQC